MCFLYFGCFWWFLRSREVRIESGMSKSTPGTPSDAPKWTLYSFQKGFSFFSWGFWGSVLVVLVRFLPSDWSGNVRKRYQNVPGRVPQRLGYVALQGTPEKRMRKIH